MKKKLITIAMALCMMMALTVPAFAADGDEITEPTFNKTASAYATSTDGTAWNYESDDDGTAKADDTTGSIYVWADTRANTQAQNTKVYKADILWGAMKFSWVTGGTWDPATHSYGNESGVWAGNGLTEKELAIKVTNHSNAAITASFAFAFARADIFNADVTEANADKVVVNFYDADYKASENCKKLTNTSTFTGEARDYQPMANAALNIATADGYTVENAPNGTVWVGISGTPDTDKAAALTATATHIGTVTVTIAPQAAA